jgi:hypothetical protein
MGTTSASVHLRWRGSSGDAAKAISRAYTRLGYERAKKRPVDGGKHVLLLAREGEGYVSIYDSTNADLDSGELKDAALAASKLLKTAAVFTSLYDSDSYEFVVFHNGRQVDLLMSDVETYDGPLKRLSDRSRVTQWGKIFARTLTADQIEGAAGHHSAFAEGTLTRLCGLVGLAGDRPQQHYADFEHEREAVAAELYFTKKTTVHLPLGDGQISLRNYFDRHTSRKLLVYPASWPMPLEREEALTWLMLSEGAGFRGGRLTIEIAGPDGLAFAQGFINGAKFHNGQIVGGYELARDTPLEVAQAYLESKRFALTPVGPEASGSRRYSAEYPNLWVPPMTPDRTTQILVVLQLHLTATRPGDWTIKATLQPQSETGYSHELPAVRTAAVERNWLPVVSGLNPKTAYDTADRADERLPDSVLDYLVPQPPGRPPEMPSAEARASAERQFAQGRERQYQFWLHDLQHKQSQLPSERGLNHPAIASNVAILNDQGQATLDICRSYLEGWLRPPVMKGAELRLRAERQMTEAFHVGKMKKAGPAASILGDKAWGRLFDCANEYQTVVIEVLKAGDEVPIAGVGFNYSLRSRKITRRGDAAAEARQADYHSQMIGLTLGKMRGRRFTDMMQGDTLHIFNWVIADDDCFEYLDTSVNDMTARIDAFAAACAPLQAWHGQATWIPRFDQADGYEATPYEDMSVLNFFRGILLEAPYGLKDRQMSAPWCRNVLRMVTPHMWLCGNLVAQLDMAGVERVAIVSEANGSTRIAKRPGCPMDEFELALLPILPIERSRITVLLAA